LILTVANEVQRTSAGAGIMHSEFNYSKTDPVYLLQIWILPEVLGLQLGYEQKALSSFVVLETLPFFFRLMAVTIDL
jgi:redox-sensitive bicupin YhaK (pirin superfamily)